MLRTAVAAIAALSLPLSLSGCLTTGGVREVRSNPPGAFLSIEGFGTCETPCTVKLDAPRQARISKTGYVAQDVVIEQGILPMTVTLELAAASTDVDAVALPDID